MNYENQTLIDMLAAEYVLGTLRGPARDRFARLMLTSTRAREATWMWEQHLNNLASSIESVPPDEAVWEKIASRIDPNVVPLQLKPKSHAQRYYKHGRLLPPLRVLSLRLLFGSLMSRLHRKRNKLHFLRIKPNLHFGLLMSKTTALQLKHRQHLYHAQTKIMSYG